MISQLRLISYFQFIQYGITNFEKKKLLKLKFLKKLKLIKALNNWLKRHHLIFWDQFKFVTKQVKVFE